MFLKGNKINLENQFKLLGSILCNSRRPQKEIKSKIEQGKFILKNKLLISNNLDLRTWTRLTKTYVGMEYIINQ